MDRRNTDAAPAQAVTFTRCGAGFAPDHLRVTSAGVVALTADGLMVVADLDRGPGPPGGHVRTDESRGLLLLPPAEILRRRRGAHPEITLHPVTVALAALGSTLGAD